MVVFAPLPPPVTGQSRATAEAADALAGVATVEVVNTADPTRVWRRPGRLPVARVQSWWHALGALKQALRTRPDVVYLTPASSPLGFVRDVLSLRLVPAEVPVVAHVHAGDYRRLLDHPALARLARRTARRYAALLVPSAYAAEGLGERLPGVSVQVIPNTIPADVRVTLAEVDRKWARAPRAMPHVAFVSIMLESKGYRRLAEAARAVEARRGGALRVTFAGPWPDPAGRRAFEAEIARAGAADRWRVVGPLEAAGVRSLLLDADVFAFPSLYPQESLSIAVLEAMNAGCGVAAIRHAGVGELIADGVEGRLAPPEAFADALFDVVADAERLGRAAAQRAHVAFAPARVDAALAEAVLRPCRAAARQARLS